MQRILIMLILTTLIGIGLFLSIELFRKLKLHFGGNCIYILYWEAGLSAHFLTVLLY